MISILNELCGKSTVPSTIGCFNKHRKCHRITTTGVRVQQSIARSVDTPIQLDKVNTVLGAWRHDSILGDVAPFANEFWSRFVEQSDLTPSIMLFDHSFRRRMTWNGNYGRFSTLQPQLRRPQSIVNKSQLPGRYPQWVRNSCHPIVSRRRWE